MPDEVVYWIIVLTILYASHGSFSYMQGSVCEPEVMAVHIQAQEAADIR